MEKEIKYYNLKDGRKIYIDGQLSKEISDFLDEEFKKEVIEEANISLEGNLFKIGLPLTVSALTSDILKKNNVGVLYTVRKNDVSLNDINNFSTIITHLDKLQINNTALLVIDDSVKESNYSSVLEDISIENNIMVYSSLKDYLTAYGDNDE